MKRVTALMLLAALILSAASCGGTDAPATGDDTTAGDVTTAADTAGEASRENTPDTLPADLDFGGTTINVFFPMSHGGEADQIDWVAEDDGEVVNSAVYNRQLKVEDRLNVKFVTHGTDLKAEGWANVLKAAVLAGDNAYDFVYGSQANTVPLVAEGIYMDLAKAKYIDYDQPWWNNNFMNEISIGGSRYLLAGDVSLSILSYMSCMYFNKPQFEKISGETSDDLYKLVLDGKWTMDALSEYCKKSWSDLNGNAEADDEDQYGMGAVTASTTDHMTFDSGIRFTEWDKSGKPSLTIVTDKSVTFAEKLYSLFYENEGIRVYPPEQDSLRIKIPNKLMQDQMTFMCGYFYSADMLRDMKSDYGIIPFPKLDETIDGYKSLVHNSAMLISVPVTCDKTDAVFASIEALGAEGYRTVTPAYYEVALKTKYIRDDVSGQIVDMIHDACTTDFAYVYSSNLKNAGVIMRELMTRKTDDLGSLWASIEASSKAGLDALIEKYNENN